MTDISPADPYALANEKSRKRKIVQDQEVASKTIKKGLLIVHTGNGKGKSTAAFGMALRTLGHGGRVAILQFTKGRWATGERKFFRSFEERALLRSVGDGFTWDTQDRGADIARAQKGWEEACSLIEQARSTPPQWDLIILDELNIALRYGHLDMDEVIKVFRERPRPLHIIVTGRYASDALRDAADLVTEMTLVKHHFRDGVKAQKGIEF